MIRILTSLMLALVLALTSQSMAVARGASAATGQMVLCTGSGPVAIYMDASGQPTSAPHICPDAAMNVVSDVASPHVAFARRLVPTPCAVVVPRGDHPLLPRLSPPQRAPPLTA